MQLRQDTLPMSFYTRNKTGLMYIYLRTFP